MNWHKIFTALLAFACGLFSFCAAANSTNYDVHKNREIDLSETDQVAVFCEPGYYKWTPPANAIDFQLLVVGGGGGGASGGNNSGGGGGGGEVIYRETVEMSPFQTYHLHVAPGAVGKTNPGEGIGGPADSSFIEGFGLERLEALGGGNGGGNWGAQAGGGGANGGGGGGSDAGGIGGQATAIGGHPGGIGAGGWKGAGGGGMSEAGHDGASGTANRGCGGAGVINSITGEAVMYGHGGGGYEAKSGRYAFSGGPNGFGDGATSANTKGNPGEDGTGGGGGAGDSGTVGGSGTVIIRYKLQSFPASVNINVSKQSDANEQGFVAGGFTVTCSEAARNVSFPVRYSVSGTATPGRTYEELSGVAIIPAGQTSVVVPVKPLSDRITEVNSTVILTIAPDSTYTVGSSSSATVTIVNDTNSTSADIRYVKPDGDDSQNGLSPATAYKSLRKAVHDFDATGHGTVYVFPGEHKLRDYDFMSLTGRSCVEVNTAVSIIGVGDTPEDTVLSRDMSQYTLPGQKGYSRRIIYMNHPKAKICNLTLSGGDCGKKTDANDETPNEAGKGGNIHIGPLGGTVEDCVIKDGHNGHWASGGCNVYMDAGLVARCVITGGKGTNNSNPATTSNPYLGTAVCAYGGIVENCLIYGNGVNEVGAENNGCTVGLWGRAHLVNCTVTDNVSDYCGGIAVLSKDAVVQNCVIYGNRVLQGATEHSAAWVSKDNNDSYSRCFVNCFSDYYIDDLNIMIDNPGFADPISHDYRLAVSSVLRDRAVGYDMSGAASRLDIERNPRRMGSSEDIGCYEFDTTVLACDFYADKTEALLRTDLGDTTFNFTAIVGGEYSGELTYEWDFNGDGVYDQSTTNPMISRKYDGIGDTGYFTIGLHVTAGGKEAFMRKVNYLHLAPQNVYVKPDSTGGIFPYNTEAKAAADLYTVIQVSLDGTVVHVAPGTYSYNVANGRPQLDRGIKVVGSDDPADTVIENVSAEKNAMMLLVNHRDAWVSGLTFKGGCNESDGQAAAGIRVTGNGGTISNCVIRQCLASKNASHAGVWLGGGLLTHCIIEENSLTNIDVDNGYNNNGNTLREQALFVNGPAAVENCLIRNCNSDGGLVRLTHADAVMRNCTIVDCTVSFCTENPRNPVNGDVTYSHPRLQWPCYAIECENGNGHVYNTVICNVKRKAYYDIFHNMTWPEADAPFCSNVKWYGDSGDGTFPEDPGCCVNCASDNAAPINSSCVLITTDDFVNYAAGDLTPKSGGTLHDAAYSIAGWAKIFDLAGNNRVVDNLDIGCYEQQTGGALRKYYVDCLFTGTSTGKKEAPFKTIQEGCAAATQVGSMVFVRGGPGRIYSLADYRDSVTVVADSNCVYGCDADWNPATDFAATNSMVIFAVADDYASQSYILRGGSTDWPAPIRVSASDCTISGFRAEFGNNSYAQQSMGGRGLIAIDGGVSGTVIENCWFKMKDEFSGYDAVSCVVSGPEAPSASAPKVVDTAIRRCYIWMGKYRASVGAIWNLHNGTRFEKNLVCHLDTLFNGSSQNCGADFHIISNIFLNCANDFSMDPHYVGWFIRHLGNGEPARGEIAYNRFIHNDGSTARYRLFQHGHNYSGCWNTDTYIHHNTIVGYDVVFESSLYNNASTGMMWLPQIFDNLIVGCGSVFDESATTKWKYGSIEYCSSFREGSMFTKNAVLADNFVTGSATTFDWYDIGQNLANTNTTKVLAEMPQFVNTTDPYSENFYRLKVPQEPWVIDAWVGDDPTFPEFPRYIGAVAPQPGGFAVRIR